MYHIVSPKDIELTIFNLKQNDVDFLNKEITTNYVLGKRRSTVSVKEQILKEHAESVKIYSFSVIFNLFVKSVILEYGKYWNIIPKAYDEHEKPISCEHAKPALSRYEIEFEAK